MRPCVLARSLTTALLTTTALSPLAIRPATAQSLPTGYATAYGRVGFQRAGGTLRINQSSQDAIVNYNSFSIGARNTVNIHQPNRSSVLLNRVTGNTPSTIAGYLNANGQVYLVNPNGIAITKTGVVKVGGGFTASSLGMTDDEFKHARRQFQGSGSSPAVTNAGTIIIGRGGYAALIGGEVKNRGSILVPMGRVGLGAGEMATLDVSGDGFLQVALPTTGTRKGTLVSNTGTISAVGGTVVLDAATARAAARNAINISGAIDAHSISGQSGAIVIGGGDGGTVRISGPISVGSRSSKGGTVTITGQTIALRHAHIDASGASGGGAVRIGGDLHGGGTLAHAGTVTIDAKSVIRADATKMGNGGGVVVWSDAETHFAGLISAKGGPQGGDGGNAEVSSHGVLDYTGMTNLTATRGAMGTLLLDPYNVIISNGTNNTGGGFTANTNDSVVNATTLSTQLGLSNVIITTGSGGTQAGNITVAAPVRWATNSLLTLTAANAIAVNADIAITGGGQLALNTGTATVGSTTQPLLSFGSGASVTFAANANQGTQALGINGNTYTLLYGMGDLPGLNNQSGRYALAGNLDASGNSYTGAVIANFSGTLEGLGHTIANVTITGSSSNVGLIGTLNPGSTVRDLGMVGGSVAGGNYVGGLVGSNYGTVSQAYATGAVSGSLPVGGLVGYNGGTVSEAYATGAVSGSTLVGGLVGDNDFGGMVSQAYATGAVAGSDTVGGLVGSNFGGTVSQAYATGAVSGAYNVGGLVGSNFGTVSQSYWDTQTSGRASSSGGTGVTTAQLAGAAVLTALNGSGTVWGNAGNKTTPYLLNTLGPVFLASDASASPTRYMPVLTQAGLQAINANASANYVLANDLDLTGTTYTGAVIANFSGTLEGLGHTIANLTITGSSDNVGLIGQLNGGTVRDLGMVGGSVSGNQYVGGLVGFNGGTVSQAYVTGAVAGNQYVGGLVGFNSIGATVTQTYATGAVSGTNYVGGLLAINNGTVSQAYATGAVSGSGYVGGLIGLNTKFGRVTQSYWDTQTSGQASSNRGVGLTTRQLQGLDPLSGGGTLADASHLGSAFSGGANGLYPYLTSFFPNGVQAISGTAYTDAKPTLAASGSAGAITVSLDAGGSRLGQATTGANGYYYLVLPAGTVANGANLVTSVPTNGSLSNAAATVAASTYAVGSPAQGGVNLYGGALTVPTSATTLSAAPSLASAKTSAGAVASAATQALVDGLSGRGLIATGAAFTIDQAVSTGGTFLVQTTASGAPLTVEQSITIASGGSLSLSAAGALAVNAPVTAQGAVPVALAYDRNTSTPALGNLSFAQGAGLSFVNADGSAATTAAGGALAINGNTYTLLYGMGDLPGLNNQSGRYALAGNLDASGSSYTAAVIGNFSGTLEGLGHTIANLTITGSSDNVGLIGRLNSGTVRDLGMVGGGITGNDNVGGLVGAASGTVTQAYVTGSVTGHNNVGGLIGANGATVSQAYATGAVTGSNFVGGLVGVNDNPDVSSMVTQSYATGAVAGSQYLGGLVGYNYYGTVSQAYATGAVSGYQYVGGLVGYNASDLESSNVSGTVTQSYATGAVAGSQYLGGLVGASGSGSVIQSYWDTQTSGQVSSNGGVGLTTRQFQGLDPVSGGGTLTDANHLGAPFAGGANGLYPYLTSFFPNGVQAITGTAQGSGASVLSGAQVGLYASGTLLGGSLVSSGANGYVYQIVPAGTLTSNGGTATIGATVTPSGGTTPTGRLYTDQATVSGNVFSAGTIITAGLDRQVTAQRTYGALLTDLATAFGASRVAGLGAALSTTPLSITGTGADFTLDQAPSRKANVSLATTGPGAALVIGADLNVGSGNTLALHTNGGAIGQGSNGTAITAGTLTGSSNGGAVSLASGTNLIGTLSDFSTGGGNLSLSVTRALTLTGAIDLGTGTLALTDLGGGITQSAGSITAGTLTGSSNGNASFTQTGNQIAALGAFTTGSGIGDLGLITASALTLTGTVDVGGGTLTLGSGGAIGQNGGTITAGTLQATAAGGLALTAANRVTTVVVLGNAGSGGLAFTNATDFTLGTGQGGGVINTSGTIALTAMSGNLTLAANAQVQGAGDVTLAAADGFVNNAGAAAVTSSGGRWLIYSANSSGDTFGGLDSRNTAVWNTGVGGAVTQAGNRYVFAQQPTLTIATTDLVKTYGDDAGASVAGAYTITGLQPGVTGAYRADTVQTALSGTPSVTSVGAGTPAGVAGSPYAITADVSRLASAAGYAIATANTGRLTVAARPLTITASGQSKTYGQTANLGTTAFIATGLVNSDTVAGVTLTSAGAAGTANVGGYTIGTSTAQGTGLSNYMIGYVGGTLNVTPAPVTVTALGGGSIYGTTLANPGLSATGLQNGESVAALTGLTNSFGIGATTKAGTYATSVSGTLSNANYTITGTVNGSWTVTPAALTITASNQSKTYGQTAHLGNTAFSETGLVNSDTVTSVSLTSPGAAGRANVGGYAIGAANAQGTGLSNYTISYVGGRLNVTPAALTITASNQSKTYGQTANLGNTAFTETGLVNSDTVTSVSLTSAATPANATVAGSPYPVTASDAQGSGLSNYTITYAAGQITVIPAPVINATPPALALTLPATTLGSSADRAAEELAAVADGRPNTLPALVRLDDPRFDISLDCVERVCTIVTARKTDRRAQR